MKFFPDLSIDTWWKAVLIIGLLMMASSLMFNTSFVSDKHLFGLGLGGTLIGVAQWMAWKTASQPFMGGILSTKIVKHNFASSLILILGVILCGFFGFQIVRALL